MQENELKKILAELYLFEPELQSHEAQLIMLIGKMQDLKPDTKFDEAFAARLKAEVLRLNAADSAMNNKKIFNFNFMNKKIYIAAGSLAVISIALIFFIKTQPGLETSNKNGLVAQNKVVNNGNDQAEISFLAAGAFGDLASVTGATIPVGESAKASAAPVGLGGGGVATRSMMSATDAVAVSAPTSLIAPDMKIMPPFYGFKYVYKGEAITLDKDSAAVYRRLKGSSAIARDLAGTLSSFGFSEVSLNTFQNLKMTNFSMVEDKDQGLMVNFDFNEDNIYISENWEKWKYVERDACGNDQACWERYRLKITDIPADEELITMSDKFLADHQVKMEHYGKAIVDNTWRDGYNIAEDKANYYVPEYATVIYPLLIDGQAVRDQSGSYAGLRVTINLIKKAASGLNGLTPYRYEASEYGLETSSDAVIKLAENGGWNRNYYMQSENVKTIELGTPEQAYVQIYKYENNRNDELLVPALIFPVMNAEAAGYYYGSKYVVVPLVKDLLKDLENQPIPMYKTMMEGGTSSSGSVGTGSASAGSAEIAPTPAIMAR